jgi:GDP-D-mannose 3', 5'-epimerase
MLSPSFFPFQFPLPMNDKIVVCGGGGFIGGHLVADLLENGCTNVRSVDVKPLDEWFQRFPEVENLQLDLQEKPACYDALKDAKLVYNLAADMGGMGFIEHNKALCMLSVLINTHLLLAARDHSVERFFFASSACVYAADKQTTPDIAPLKESDAYPAMPEDGYGWEKLFSERMCRHFREDFGLTTRVARYHNVYGPHGTFEGGREKAPAAICRKVIEAKLSGRHEIEIWGDGHQTRSFMFIEDCLKGTKAIMDSDIIEPINLGSSEMVTINQLVDIAEEIAGLKLDRRYNLSAPKGVNGRNSDNTLIQKYLGWEPSTPLREGLEKTYRWIFDQMARRGK